MTRAAVPLARRVWLRAEMEAGQLTRTTNSSSSEPLVSNALRVPGSPGRTEPKADTHEGRRGRGFPMASMSRRPGRRENPRTKPMGGWAAAGPTDAHPGLLLGASPPPTQSLGVFPVTVDEINVSDPPTLKMPHRCSRRVPGHGREG
jgi:hypothetical protein